MAMTVRFPNGQAVTYNDAMFCSYGNEIASLYTLANLSRGGRLLAELKKKLAGFSLRYRRFG